MIDTKTAADVAKRAGLGLPDARALAALAENKAEAEELAAMFSPLKIDLAVRKSEQ